MFYVYIYFDPRKSPMEPIYVGKGKGDRIRNHRFSGKSSNKILKAKIKRIREMGLEPISLKIVEDISEEEAFAIEKDFISIYGRIDIKTGALCNFTEGGEGTSGFPRAPMSQETKDKLSKSKTGRKLSEEHKNKLRKINLGKKMSAESIEKTRLAHLGSKRSKETCSKIGAAKKGVICSKEVRDKISKNSANKRSIIQLDKNGVFIREWESAAACEKATGFHASNISVCCSGKRKYAFGFAWQFKSDYIRQSFPID